MKKYVFLIAFVFVAFVLHAQRHGIGLRLGYPAGITYKKYLPHYRAIELGIGGASPQWYSNYYQNSFEEYSQYNGYSYLGHTVESNVYLQARYLLHYSILVEQMVGRLDWYWGVGGMLKVAKVRYRLTDADSNIPQTDIKTDIDLGPEGALGMEYLFADIPITLYGELSLLIELADRPGAVQLFGGLGLRYNFRAR
jgi:hypothetical protein